MIYIKAGLRRRRIFGRQCVAGFTLLELMVVICIASVLATVFAGRLLYYQELAEKATFELVLARTKMGLRIHMAELIMTRRQQQVIDLEKENPMQWLEEPPPNYAGEYSAPPKSGHWYYATREHEMVYVPTYSSYLDAATAAIGELRFRVVVPMQDDPATGSKTPAGVGLKPVREYKWL
jgi:prepilin-type N-terminal cleavage/methylation domain-containing protein